MLHACRSLCVNPGGHPGAAGKNILKRIDDSSLHDLGPKSSVQVFPGVSYISAD